MEKGEMMMLDKFPKTSPLAKDVWHCLCVKWTADDDSSVWVNARKIKSFIAGYNAQSLILGGQFLNDDTGFHGDIALFQVYNNDMKDEELFMIQTKWCDFFKIPSDDIYIHKMLYNPFFHSMISVIGFQAPH